MHTLPADSAPADAFGSAPVADGRGVPPCCCDQRPLLRLWPAVLARMHRAARREAMRVADQFSIGSASTRDSIVDSSSR